MQVGDTVRLKCNGPLMTVLEVEEGGNVKCAWFNHSQDGYFPHTVTFPTEALVPVKLTMFG